MEDLIELVAMFQKTKFKSTGLMGLVLEPGSQMLRLYEGIVDGTILSDEDVLKAFPELDASAARAAVLKSKMKDRLQDAILLLDWKEPAYMDRQKAFSECSRKWASAMVLMSKGAKKSAVNLLEGILRNARRFEFTEMVINVLQSLSMHFALIEGDLRKYEETEAELASYENIWKMERHIERLYIDLVNGFVRRKSLNESFAEKAKECLDEVKPYMNSCFSYRVQLFGRLIEIAYYDSIGDYTTTARISEAGLDFFNQKNYRSTTALQALHYHLFVAYLNLREYETCQRLVNQYQDLFEVGSYNWFKLYEIVFLTAMHAGHYRQASDIYYKTVQHPAFEAQPAPVIELWKIFEAYIAFLYAVKELEEDQSMPKFKLAKFLNEVGIFAQDKSGMNISVQIVQFLHYLAIENFEACMSRVDALAKYRVRYLAEEDTFRSQAFIRMLEQIPKASFQSDKVEYRCQIIYKALCDRPLESANQNHEVEVIPYEMLWKIILKWLSNLSVNRGSNAKGAPPLLTLAVL